MCEWLTGDDGKIAVDRVLRQETLAADTMKMIADLKIDAAVPEGRVNVSERGEYRDYYTRETADIIAGRHARDIALFGYTF